MKKARPALPLHADAPLPGRFHRHASSPEAALVSPNERSLLAAVWEAPETTRASLTSQMDLTQQSVHRLLTGLQEDGLIAFGPMVPPASRGKPSPQILLNPRYGCAIGVALNTDTVGIACMDFAGGHLARRIDIAGAPVDAVLDRVDGVIGELLGRMRFAREDILGLGFGIAAFLMEDGRYNPPDPIAHWSEVDLAPLLARRFGVPCWTDNGANTAALCEAMFGLGRSYRDMAYLSFNYGFGAGIIADGELLRGGFGNAGEIGMVYTPDEGNRRPALGLLLKKLRHAGHEMHTVRDLDRAMSPMWPEVRDWVSEVQPQFDRALNAIAAISNPQCVVLGGEVPRPLAQAFIDAATFFTQPRRGRHNPLPRLEISMISGETSAIGAACLPLRAMAF